MSKIDRYGNAVSKHPIGAVAVPVAVGGLAIVGGIWLVSQLFNILILGIKMLILTVVISAIISTVLWVRRSVK